MKSDGNYDTAIKLKFEKLEWKGLHRKSLEIQLYKAQ